MSFTVFDPETGGEVEVTAQNLEVVRQGLADGTLRLRPGQEISVTDRDGRVATLQEGNPEHLQFLGRVVAGREPDFRLSTRAEVQDVLLSEKYRGRGFEAAMSGFLQGIPFYETLADLSAEEREYLTQLRKENPLAGGAGEVASTAGLALLSGGLAAEMRGAQTASGLVRAGMGTDALAPQIAARGAAQGVLARAGQRAVPAMLEGAVEGGVYGIGQAADEAALADRPITAEALLAGGLSGALFGGVPAGILGGALGAGEGLFEASARLIGRSGVVDRYGRRAAQQLYRTGAGVELSDSVADDIVRASDPEAVFRGRAGDLLEATARRLGLGDEAAETARRLATDDAFNRLATQADDVLGDLKPRLKKQFDELSEIGDLTDDIVRARAKREMFERGITSPLPMEARQAGAQLMDEIEALAIGLEEHRGVYGLGGARVARQLRELVEDPALGVRVRMPFSPGDMEGAAAAIRQLPPDQAEVAAAELAARMTADADDLAASLTVGGAVDQALVLDQIKRRIGAMQRTRDPNIKAELRDLYEKFRVHLEDESFYGGGATAQREMNEAISRWIANDDVFSKLFLTKSGRRSKARPWEDQLVFDPSKASRWYDVAGTPDGQIVDDVLEQQVTGLEDVFRRTRDFYDLPDDVAKRIDTDVPRASREIRESAQTVRDSVGARNAFRNLQEAAGPRLIDKIAGGAGPTVTGAVLGGAPGAAVGGAISLALALRRNMPDVAAQLGRSTGGRPLSAALLRAQAAALEATDRIGAAARDFVRGTPARQRRLARSAGALGGLAAVGRARIGFELFRERAEQVLDVDEQTAADRSARAVAGFADDAPETTALAQQKLTQAVLYLRSTLPASSLPDPEVPGDTVQPSAPHEMIGWLRRSASVEDPVGAAERAAAGLASPEELETLDAVYPEISRVLRESVREELVAAGEAGDEVPWHRRQQIWAQLGIRADRATGQTLTLQTQLGVQPSPLAQPPGPQQPGGGAFSPPARPLGQGRAERDTPSSEAGYGLQER